jgi:uncharacterized damage-inducible protein DinB
MTPSTLPEVTAIHAAFTRAAVARLRQQESRILDCLSRLTDEQIWWRPNEHSNSIGNLVLHLVGNLGQWVVAGVGGQLDVRNREAEFSARSGVSGPILAASLKARLDEVVWIIETLPAERLLEEVTPQGYTLPVMEVIMHITEHFNHHGGQIILLTKWMLDIDLGYYRHLSGNNTEHSEKVP